MKAIFKRENEKEGDRGEEADHKKKKKKKKTSLKWSSS